MSRTIELAEGITASVADDVTPATISALREMACAARHREVHGYIAADPMEIKEGVNYENREVRCAACGSAMPNAPWPTNSTSWLHRPRCGKCNSPMTYPAAR